jgi:hypothetical protein
MHATRPLLIAMTGLLVCCLGRPVVAQLTITNPDEDKAATKVRQVSLSTSAPPIMSAGGPAAYQGTNTRQLKIRIQFLRVDQETREAIYAGIGADAIQTSTNITKPQTQEPESASLASMPTYSGKIITSAARLTQTVLNSAEVASILKMTEAATDSVVDHAPSLILLEGKRLELTDLVERPFIVNHEKQGEATKPILQIVEEGTRLGVLANLTTPAGEHLETIELSCEIISRRVVDIKTDYVFGVQSEPLEVQVPLHQTATVRASAMLVSGQTLLIDPHMSSTKNIRNETSVPLLGKIPYLGRSFKNVALSTLDQHMIVLLRPELANGK